MWRTMQQLPAPLKLLRGRSLLWAWPASLRIGAPLAITFAAVGLEHLVTKMGELAEKTQMAATSAGMGMQQYSQLQRTLFLLTGDVDRVNKVLGTFSVSINQALTQP